MAVLVVAVVFALALLAQHRSLTIVEHPTESRDIDKSIWRPPPRRMALGVAVMNAIAIQLGAAQSAAAAQQC
jgi:hypothetical protein